MSQFMFTVSIVGVVLIMALFGLIAFQAFTPTKVDPVKPSAFDKTCVSFFPTTKILKQILPNGLAKA